MGVMPVRVFVVLSAVLLLGGCLDEGPREASRRSCHFDTDCYVDEFCSDFGWCRLLDGCRTDLDCRDGKRCGVDGSCIEARVCASDVDCVAGTFCDFTAKGGDGQGLCALIARCLSAQDCAAGQICAGDGYCHSDSSCQVHRDCPTGLSCDESGVCFAVGVCEDNGDCEPKDGLKFYCGGNGFCYRDTECVTDFECAPGSVCASDGRCDNAPLHYCSDGCPADDPDQNEFWYCDGLICRPGVCTDHFDCAPGYICAFDTGSCELATTPTQ